MRKSRRVFSLSRPKLRQSWNKHNLYNLARMAGDQPEMKGNKTFFQQKWDAKSRSRAYHGDHIPEKKWVRLFSRHLQSVVDMPPAYLGANDGAEQAAGRGSGLTTNQVTAEKFWTNSTLGNKIRISHPRARKTARLSINNLLSKPLSEITPYMQMTFAPLERRLDTAIFRALFASSVRQARQFVVHGAVTVNGKKMVHASYQLNPGDMFQVDVEKVLYGTGAQKTAASKKSLARRIAIATKKDAWLESQLNEDGTEATAIEGSEGESATEAAAAESSGSADAETTTEVVSAEEREWAVRAQALENLLLDVKFVLRDKDQLSARNRVRLRNFVKSSKKFLAHPDDGDIEINELINELQLNMKSLKLEGESFQGVLPAEEGVEGAEGEEGDQAKSVKPRYNRKRMIDKALELEGLVDEQWKAKAIDIIGYEDMTKEEMRSLAQVLKRESENPVDDSKPYATPWRPRPFMSAFAFVPRYLEVNPNICAAVYLRHPVARKGLGEVPTPFPYFTNQLAHNWYLERG